MAFTRLPKLSIPSREALVPSVEQVIVTIAPILIPLGVLVVQTLMWDLVAPHAWLSFLPAVALSAWVAGLRGGLLAMVVSTGAAEWLLLYAEPQSNLTQEPRFFSLLLFTVLCLGVILMLDQARRQIDRLHRTIVALRGAAIGPTPVSVRSTGGISLLQVAQDVAVVDAVRQELLWRKATFWALPIPIAVFAVDGSCLYANPAFANALGIEAASFAQRNLLRPGDYPGTALMHALQRLVAVPGEGRTEHAVLGRAGECLLQWLPSESGGVVCCTVWSSLPRAEEAAALPAVAPAAPAPGSAARVLPEVSLVGLRCLVVDDQALNRDLLRELLQLEGAEVTCCAGGREALALLGAQAQAFDVVLMDLQMPGMDGYAAARALRALPGMAALPIFAVTADGPGIPQQRLRDAGMFGVLHKPLDVDRLRALLATLRA